MLNKTLPWGPMLTSFHNQTLSSCLWVMLNLLKRNFLRSSAASAAIFGQWASSVPSVQSNLPSHLWLKRKQPLALPLWLERQGKKPWVALQEDGLEGRVLSEKTMRPARLEKRRFSCKGRLIKKLQITRRCCWRQFLLNQQGKSVVGQDCLRETTSRAQEGSSH